MKKFLLCVSVLLLLGSVTVFAKTGDVNGSIYATDIKAVINGVTVPSYAIDGKTVVVVEEITDQYQYSDTVRSLTFNDLAPASLKEGEHVQSEPVGTKLGNTYETDIKVYLNGRILPAYAIDGKMAVAIEDMGGDQKFNEVGGKYKWNPETRTISLEYIYYRDVKEVLKDFKSVSAHGQIYFDNVVIDRENEIVTFRYDKDYKIDLKTGEMTEIK